MTSAGSEDEMGRDLDDTMMDYDMEKDTSFSDLSEDSDDDIASPVDFSDLNFDRRSGRPERRNSPFGDRRKTDRRRASPAHR